MKHFIHLFGALIVAVLAISNHSSIVSDAVAKAVTTHRLYVMKLMQPSVLESAWQTLWPAATDPCLTMTNLSQEASGACLQRRVGIRNTILTQAGCASWQNRSQACTLISRVVQGLAFNVTNASPPYVAGRNLAVGANPLYRDHNPQEYISRTLANAPLLMHNAYRASVSENNYAILPSAVHLLLPIFAVLNMIGQVLHYAERDAMFMPSLPVRISTIIYALAFIVLFSVYMALYTEMQPITAVILVPPFVFFLWFDFMLPSLDHRPFVHPAVFGVVYPTVTLLALLSNGVQNYRFIMIELLKAAGVGQVYMGIIWYFMGLWEKVEKRKDTVALYRTKGAYLSVVLAMAVLALTPGLTWLSPYDFSFDSPFLAIAPLVFVVLAVTGLVGTKFMGSSWHDEGVSCFFNFIFVGFVIIFVMINYVDVTSISGADSSTSRWIQTSIQFQLGQDSLLGPGLPSS